MIEITTIAKTGGPLTKSICLSPDGKLVSDGSGCVMSTGAAQRLRLSSLHDFATRIHGLEFNQAIALGALDPGLPDQVEITTKRQLDTLNGHAPQSLIARTAEHIQYRRGQPALALLDFDAKGMPANVAGRIRQAGGFWKAVVSVLPELEHIARVVRRSTSSGIFRKDTGTALPGSNGMHVFLLVQNGGDVERFLRTLHERCWLTDLGWMMVGAGGQLLERSIIDRTVFSPERLVFEAAPILADPLAQDREGRAPIVTHGASADTAAICRDLTTVERARLKDLRAREAMRLNDEAAVSKAAFVRTQAKRIVDRAGVSAETARQVVERQCAGVLLPHIVLPFDAVEFEGCTGGNVLADPDRFVGATLADPLEGPEYGRCKAKIMRRADGSIWINSFAHGRCSYDLKHDAGSIDAAIRAAARADVADVLTRMLLNADVAADAEQTLRALACEMGGVKARPLNAKIKAAREHQEQQRLAEKRARHPAERTDKRVQLPVPPSDGERTPVLQMLDEVLCAVTDPEPPMRDMEGRPVEIRCRPPTMLHELTSSGSNTDEEENTWLPPPALPLMTRHDRYSLAHEIERYIEFVVESEKDDTRSVALPPIFVDHFLAWRDSAIPRIEAIITAPLVLPDGSLLASEGLDRAHRLVFRIEPDLRRLMPSDCTPKAVADALDFLVNGWFCDVSTDFQGKCILIAQALTILERVLFPERPAFFITAGKRGGGKTTALTMLILAVTGKKPPAAAWSSNEEERRKAMLAYLAEGLAALVWDNLPLGATISCPTLEKVLTAESYSDRVLSQSAFRTVPAFTVMSFTGNNIAPRGDMASRSLTVRLNVDRPDPENRSFNHADPIAWTLDHRGDILRALYTIMLGNQQLEPGQARERKTRFKVWWHLVGSAVENAAAALIKDEDYRSPDKKTAKQIDFGAIFAAVEAEDEESGAISDVLEILHREWPGSSFEAGDIVRLLNDFRPANDEERKVLAEFFDPAGRRGGAITAIVVGKRLKAFLGTPVHVGDRQMTLMKKGGDDGGVRRTARYEIRISG